jgi:hypothetical protein
MSSQDAKRAADAGSAAGRLTRRSLLRGAATAGAAGLAATAMGAAAGPALASASQPAVPGQAHGHGHHDQHEPIVVHVRDARSGDIEVFAGTRQTQFRDKDLAARIARSIG